MRAFAVHAALTFFLLGPVASRLSAEDSPAATGSAKPAVIKVGAVAYAPSAVTIFEGIKRHFERQGQPFDYVLYSNYDSLVDALSKGQVDVAWNTPLAHARFHVRAGDASQALVMRDVDRGFRSVLLVRTDAGVRSPADLAGKSLVLGSRQAAESTVLPLHFLKQEGIDVKAMRVLNMDGEVDLRGNPCSSEAHVLKALQDGRGQAGIIGERLWNHLSKEQPDQVSGLRAIWITPPFSHCVFTAAKGFDRRLAERFTSLMLAMDVNDPRTTELMKLEGTRKWLPGSQDGFQELFNVVRAEAGCCGEEGCCAAGK
jgi:ABC-type phosphate/phosphonate transport system substrate-binding protein